MGRVIRSLKHGWNLFKEPEKAGFSAGPMTPNRPNRNRGFVGSYYSSKSITGAIYSRLAVDFSQVEFYHAMLNDDDVAIKVVRDNLNDCLTLNPNIDQTAMAMKIDLALTMFETGHAAVVPTEADLDPATSLSYDIRAMRVGTVSAWHPRKLTLMVYDDREVDESGELVNGGISKQVVVEKEHVAVVENPFFDVMNAPNSNLQRLQKKLSQIDGIDEIIAAGKLDLIFQLPYTVRGDSRKRQAEMRRQDLRDQLRDDELGIGYIDVSEKVIQLNRQVDNKLLEQVKDLYDAVFAELGLTPEIMNGTASRDTINNYYDRTIEPIANAVAQEYRRKFLTKTARTRRHSIEIYRDPLKLIPMSELAEVVDKLSRSSVASANDIRPKIGLRPSSQPGADMLANPNMPLSDQVHQGPPTPAPTEEVEDA